MLEYGNDVKKRMQNAKKMLYKIWICAIMELNRRYDTMAQTSVNFRMDADLKESVEEICRKMGMNLTTAITIFCTKVAQERRIPFEITADPDPFYSESNIRYLEKKMEDYKAGRLKFAEHGLIEE